MAEERLQKVLRDHGICSRRKAEELIKAGRVKVNGEPAYLGQKVDPQRDEILVDGKPLPPPPQKVYYLFHKPRYVISSLKDPQGRLTILEFLKGIKERVFPVGRLDWDSEGLMLLTNDGELANKLLHPRYGLKRVYLVKVKGIPKEEDLAKLREGGIPLEDGPSPKMEIKLIKRGRDSCWLKIGIFEGRKRIIRRSLLALGYPVKRLKRIGFGPLRLKGLEPGKWRPLSAEEIKELKKWTTR